MPAVSLAPYRRALASRPLRSALVLGALVRGPVFASGVLLTIHTVSTLGRSYTAAGALAAAATVAIAVSGPWRGRLLDRFGLRRVVLPSVLVALACWSVAPFVGYWLLLVLAVVAGLFVIPTFSITRQAVIAAVPENDRRTAISLDSVAVEIAFIVAPALAVWAATQWSTAWVLFATQMLGVAAGLLMWVVDPPLRGEGEARVGSARAPRRSWFRLPFLAVCLAATATTVVLAGSDIAIVAVMRELGSTAQIGLVLAVWGLGSLVGGLLYGALHRSISAFWLLGGLAVATFPMALATSPWGLAGLGFVAGLLCAPTITATVDQASRIVPAEVRGEAMGWHGSFLTTGGALGAPLAGLAIDGRGPSAGFVAVALVGLAVAGLGLTAVHARRYAGGVTVDARRFTRPSGPDGRAR
ncbi:MFS transporter [Fodinibacter luteus]|uniref:MFS transporter n=1 Tax=Fodinibacter luteus TaxID=552064 RepID=A0ABP8KB07_9MICO